jgi:FHA domain-containing protein
MAFRQPRPGGAAGRLCTQLQMGLGMNLVIRAVSLAGAPLSQSITGYFDARGGTIGRSDTNTMALPDPERHVSRLQAEVSQSGPKGGFVIRNVSTTNAFLLNDQRIAPGQAHVLSHGDELQIGTYVLKVEHMQDNDTVRTITLGRAAVDAQAVIRGSASELHTDPRNVKAAARSPAPITAPSGPAFPAAARANPAVVKPTPGAASAASDPFGLGAGPLSNANPFADLLGTPAADASPASSGGGLFDSLLGASPSPAAPTPSPMPMPSPVPAAAARVAPPAAGLPLPSAPAAPSSARLPEDFDPFADLFAEPKAKAAPPAAAANTSGAIADVLGSVGAPSGSPSLNTMFGLNPKPTSGPDPLADFLAPAASSGTGQPLSLDPLDLLKPAAPAAATPPASTPRSAGVAAASNHTPELKAAFTPPQLGNYITETMPAARLSADLKADLMTGLLADKPAAAVPLFPPSQPAVPPQTAEPEPVAPPAVASPAAAHTPPVVVAALPTTSSSASAATAEELWAAFCEGTGAPFNPAQGLNPDLMRMIGRILRQAVDGTQRLMAVRATTKQELRANVTVIQPRNNNPLKFAPDGQAGLEQLLQPPLRGFLAGPQAMDDAMDDLLSHAIGTMAGMRAALDGVLDRFAPQRLEDKLVGRSVIDNLLPMNRRAKLWELYLQHFDGVSAEAREDFHTLFGKAFLEAYEEQLDRLDAQRRKAG